MGNQSDDTPKDGNMERAVLFCSLEKLKRASAASGGLSRGHLEDEEVTEQSTYGISERGHVTVEDEANDAAAVVNRAIRLCKQTLATSFFQGNKDY